ncbi:hypothetical protein HXY33_01615 [Candidatus Bathyarchaeota archaeon]|nr:hypothetical protein [Candidatus Bathyarchaeota archaeon]
MVNVTVEKLVQLTGELKNNSPSSEKFRTFISSPDIARTDLETWVNECLAKTGESFEQAFQDIVNCIGEKLGFKVEYGQYKAGQDMTGYDGKWVSEEASIQLVLEIRRADSYQINADQFGQFMEDFKKKIGRDTEESKKLKVPEIYKRTKETYGIVVTAEEEPIELLDNIRKSRYKSNIRIIPVRSLLNVFKMKEEIPLKHVEVARLLLPMNVINIGEIIHTIESMTGTQANKE